MLISIGRPVLARICHHTGVSNVLETNALNIRGLEALALFPRYFNASAVDVG